MTDIKQMMWLWFLWCSTVRVVRTYLAARPWLPWAVLPPLAAACSAAVVLVRSIAHTKPLFGIPHGLHSLSVLALITACATYQLFARSTVHETLLLLFAVHAVVFVHFVMSYVYVSVGGSVGLVVGILNLCLMCCVLTYTFAFLFGRCGGYAFRSRLYALYALYMPWVIVPQCVAIAVAVTWSWGSAVGDA